MRRLSHRFPYGARALISAMLAIPLVAAPVAASLPDSITVRNFFGDGYTFDRPLLFQELPGEDSVYLVVQQLGAMVLVRNVEDAWVKSRFDSVAVGRSNLYSNNDAGLLGFAFHPNYRENRKYYVFYVQDHAISPFPGTIILAERTADSTLLQGSGNPERVLLSLEKPYAWHNGGTLGFDGDGYLYTGIGDGGGGGDPGNRAQNPGTLHGKFLRIDVDGPDAFPDDSTRNYAIPPDNPFVTDSAYLPEIWAVGLRNPWKWTFHPETGEIWAGDVGQMTREKVTRVPKGSNLGWKMWEGTHCFSDPCSWTGILQPVLDLEPGESVSVTGGVFLTGDPQGAFHGLYIFGDFGRNHVWGLRLENGLPIERVRIGEVQSVVSFDKDSRGRVFAVSIRTPESWDTAGTVHILEFPDTFPAPGETVAVLRERARPDPASRVSMADVLRNPARYEVRALDGRILRGTPSGTVWVRAKASPHAPQLVTVLR